MKNNIGLRNINSICYLNSIIQSLISINNFNKGIKKKKEEYIKDNNEIGMLFYNIIIKIEKEIEISEENYIMSQKLGYSGQQCAHEVLIKIIEKLNMEDLFKIKHEKSIYCTECEIITNTSDDISYIYENFIDEDENITNIINQNINTLNDYKCDDCEKKVKQIIINNLKETNDVFIIIFNQYYKKRNKKYEKILNLYTGNYKLKAKIEHIGSQYGGHYWAKRYKEAQIIKIDDELISREEEEEDIKSKYIYMLLYERIN
tara:strand:- start:2017 stop:2796 length:780 start_codon:yes stop_codon:yes gene_type:complete